MTRFISLLNEFKRDLKNSEICRKCALSPSSFTDLYAERYYTRENIIKLCFGLNITHEEAVELMKEAGFAFTSSERDSIIQNGLLNKFSFDKVNSELYEKGQKTLTRS